MKGRYYLLIGLILAGQLVAAQKTIETWYDEHWEECHEQLARYYSHRTNTDSGWFRKDIYVSTKQWQMRGLYEDKECTIRNGSFTWFYPDGKLKAFGNFTHDKKNGLHLEFFPDGTLKDSAFYINDQPRGTSSGWFKNGNQAYVLIMDDNGNGTYTSWFENAQPSSAGRYKQFEKMNGRWQFFHKNGKVSAVELYELGNLQAAQYFNEDGVPESDTSKISASNGFPGGSKAWYKFIFANIYFPGNVDIRNGYRAVVMVSATVNEEGKLTDFEIDLPLHPELDKVAIDALKKSPRWAPARNHNRNIASRITQTVSFERSYD